MLSIIYNTMKKQPLDESDSFVDLAPPYSASPEDVPAYFNAYRFRVGRTGVRSLPYYAGPQETHNWLFAYFQSRGLSVAGALTLAQLADGAAPALYALNESGFEDRWNELGGPLFRELHAAPCGRVRSRPRDCCRWECGG